MDTHDGRRNRRAENVKAEQKTPAHTRQAERIIRALYAGFYRFKRYLLLTVLLVTALAFRLICYHGLWDRDDIMYAARAAHAHQLDRLVEHAAERYPDEKHNFSFMYTMRYPILLLTRAAYRIGGMNEFAVGLPALYLSLALVALLFMFLYTQFGTVPAFFGALITALHPLDINLASQLYPDSLLPCFLLGAAALYHLGLEKERSWAVIVSGVVFAAAVYIRIYAVFLIPVYVVLTLAPIASRRFPRRAPLCLVGFLLVVLPVEWWCYQHSGEWLVRLRMLKQNAYYFQKYFPIQADWQTILFYARQLIHSPLHRTITLTVSSLLPVYLIHLIVSAARKKRSPISLALPLLAFAALYLSYEFASTSFDRYSPPHKLPRFASILIPFISWWTAAALRPLRGARLPWLLAVPTVVALAVILKQGGLPPLPGPVLYLPALLLLAHAFFYHPLRRGVINQLVLWTASLVLLGVLFTSVLPNALPRASTLRRQKHLDTGLTRPLRGRRPRVSVLTRSSYFFELTKLRIGFHREYRGPVPEKINRFTAGKVKRGRYVIAHKAYLKYAGAKGFTVPGSWQPIKRNWQGVLYRVK